MKQKSVFKTDTDIKLARTLKQKIHLIPTTEFLSGNIDKKEH